MAQYGRVGGRRRGNAAWQWLIIGFFPGLLCGGLVIFGLALTGVLQGLTAGPTPTPPPPEEVVLVVTATQDPNAPTTTPMVITATSEPTTEVEDAVMVQASPTTEVETNPTGEDTSTDTQSTDTGDTTVDTSALTPQAPLPTVPSVNAQDTSGNTVPQALANTISDTRVMPAGTFPLGTTRNEVIVAAEQCLTRDGGNCDPADGEDSAPPVDVQLSSFEIEVTEVTFGQYVDFLNYLRSQGSDHLTGCGGFLCVQTLNELAQESGGIIVFDGATYEAPTTLTNFPVWGVSWYGAKTYCETIGRRLPTEAEWEYAASGAGSGITDSIYPWGNEFQSTNAKTRIPVDAAQGPVAVGTYGQDLSGLYDMAGNLAEWVSDWYQADYYAQLANLGTTPVDPQGPPTGVQKVLRGGSWNTMPFFVRTAHRLLANPLPTDQSTIDPRSIGFRCAADATATDTSGGAVDPASLGVEVPSGEPTAETPADAAPTLEPLPTATIADTSETGSGETDTNETSSSESTEGGTSQRG